MFIGYGEILPEGTGVKLQEGETFALTLNLNTTFQPSVESVRAAVKQAIGQQATLLSVSQATMSNRFVIVFKANSLLGIGTTIQSFKAGLQTMGYPNVSVVQIETGDTSSQEGGLSQFTRDMMGRSGEFISKSLWAGVKPLLPWIAVGVVGYLGFQIYLKKKIYGQ